MKVKKLIEKLQKFDPELLVVSIMGLDYGDLETLPVYSTKVEIEEDVYQTVVVIR